MEEKIVKATVDQIEVLTAFAEEKLEAYGASMKAQAQIAVVIDEIFNNIASYAYPEGTGEAAFSLNIDEKTGILTLVFRDSGIPYNPLEHEDPDVTLAAEERKIGGLGIFMVKKMMDNLVYSRKNGQNVLTLEKNLNAISGKDSK